MPIETSQHLLALRSQKNAQVAHNLARLWEIARHSHSAEHILKQLHPWGASGCLKFDNSLAIFIALLAVLLLLPLLAYPTLIWAQLLFLAALGLGFLSYLLYAPQTPIQEVIKALEHSMIQKRYALEYQSMPSALGRPLSSGLVLSQLKQRFAIFDRGSISNDIPFFACSTWQEANGQTHQVLIFQYHYVNQLSLPSKDKQTGHSQEIHRDLWGVFIFDLDHDFPTFAVSTEHKKLPYPYHLPWHSSDIQLRERVYIGGENPLDLAKKITPSLSLKLADFFARRRGELYIDQEQNILCYLGREDLMSMTKQGKKIDDISALRGHLRTLRLPQLERLQQQLLVLLE